MAQALHKFDLRDLRRNKALRQDQLGGTWMVVQVEAGRRLPGPALLSRWASRLELEPEAVMAACRESQRRALVARARSGQVVEGHRRASCAHRSAAAVRKAGRS